jgi:hypothetical protein
VLHPQRRGYAVKTEAVDMRAGAIDESEERTTKEKIGGGRERPGLPGLLEAIVQTKRSPDSDDLSLQVSLVAGAGFEPATFGL